jgi:hypothetical protein
MVEWEIPLCHPEWMRAVNRGTNAPIFDGLESPIAMALARILCEVFGHVPQMPNSLTGFNQVCRCCLQTIRLRWEEEVTTEWGLA